MSEALIPNSSALVQARARRAIYDYDIELKWGWPWWYFRAQVGDTSPVWPDQRHDGLMWSVYALQTRRCPWWQREFDNMPVDSTEVSCFKLQAWDVTYDSGYARLLLQGEVEAGVFEYAACNRVVTAQDPVQNLHPLYAQSGGFPPIQEFIDKYGSQKNAGRLVMLDQIIGHGLDALKIG